MTHRIIPIRASSAGGILDCALRWEAEQIIKRRRPLALRTWLGSSIHHGTAMFDQAQLDGDPISIDAAAGEMVDMLYTPDEPLERDLKLTLNEAERIALVLLTRYCTEIAPKKKYQSVEMKLKPLVVGIDSTLAIEFTGTMDRARVIETLSGDVVDDIKSGARLIESDTGRVIVKARAAQVGIYQLLKENTDGRPTVGAQITALQTSREPKIGMSHIFNAKAQMLGDPARGVPGLIEIIGKMLSAGLFPPNPSSQLCSKRYCANWNFCAYHE